jgi:hypothetical protein
VLNHTFNNHSQATLIPAFNFVAEKDCHKTNRLHLMRLLWALTLRGVVLTNIIIVIVVSLVLGLFFKIAKNSKPIEATEGVYTLCYSNYIKWGCMGLVIFGSVGLTVLLVKTPIKDSGDLIAVLSMYGALFLFGIYFYIEFFTVKI